MIDNSSRTRRARATRRASSYVREELHAERLLLAAGYTVGISDRPVTVEVDGFEFTFERSYLRVLAARQRRNKPKEVAPGSSTSSPTAEDLVWPRGL